MIVHKKIAKQKVIKYYFNYLKYIRYLVSQFGEIICHFNYIHTAVTKRVYVTLHLHVENK